MAARKLQEESTCLTTEDRVLDRRPAPAVEPSRRSLCHSFVHPIACWFAVRAATVWFAVDVAGWTLGEVPGFLRSHLLHPILVRLRPKQHPATGGATTIFNRVEGAGTAVFAVLIDQITCFSPA